MEIQKSTIWLFYASRIFGLSPFLVTKNKTKHVIDLKLSILLCIYNVLVLAVTAGMTFRGIINDAESSAPIRMKTATSKFVTSFDVIVVVGACFFAVLCSIIGFRHTQEMNRKLKEVDEVLSDYTDESKDTRRCILMLTTIVLGLTAILGMDAVSRLRAAKKNKSTAVEMTLDENFRGYIPFYLLYYILMISHAQFAQTALGIGKRYRRLNIALRTTFHQSSAAKTIKSSVQIIHVPSLKIQASESFQQNKGGSTTVSQEPYITKNIYFIDRLANTHALLADTVANVSSAFGLAILGMLVSCLLHLVATSYFLLMEILGDNDLLVAFLQFLWLFFHVVRLLLIVEPCHATSSELKKFWRQLLAEKSYYFSACGMCKIDREILTSISGAIATYLVILIQFQKTNG